jgi:low temperature requirement protein LtrA
MVAGIVLAALGLKTILADVGEHLDWVPAFALLGGVAAYLLGHVAFRYRHIHTINRQRLALGLGLFALLPAATAMPPLATVALIDAILAALIAYETHRYGEGRNRLRHPYSTG